MELQINQKIEKELPLLDEETFKLLEDSILLDGCLNPIVTWNRTIVDGHHRYKICQKHDIPFNIIEKEFEDEDEAISWLCLHQAARRNEDKVTIARRILKGKSIIEAKAREKQSQAGGDKKSIESKSLCPDLDKAIEPINTLNTLAKSAGLSRSTLAKIEKVDKEAPTVIKEAMGKSISVDKADKLNNVLKFVPEQDREEEARRLIEKEFEEKCKEIDRQHKICNKLHDIIYISAKYFEYGTDDDIDIYISNAVEKTSDIIVGIDDTIAYLQELRKKFVERNGIRRVK